MNKIKLVAASVILASSALAASTASAEVSYNIGYASEYYFRGLLQKVSSGSAGIDFESSGFYVGSWAADVGDGLEIDGYFGYGIETEAGLSASVGFTGYYYTGDFDDTYQEINLNLGYSIFSLEYSVGQWDGFGADLDYDFLALTVASENGFYGKYGTFGDDFDGDYVEVGYGTTISEIDFGVSAIFQSDELQGGDEALVFTIGKSF